MSVTEVLEAVGSWTVNLQPSMPRAIFDSIDFFGHIAIAPGRMDPKQLGDNMLTAARYVGVIRDKSSGDSFSIGGGGMILWLGDEDDKGNVLENATTFVTASFPNVIRGLLPPAITEGTLYSLPGTYSGTHQWETPRTAIKYVCDTFGASFRVNNNGTIDAGLASSLYRTTPTAAIVRHGAGHDTTIAGLPGQFESDVDVEDFTTRVVLLAEGDGTSIYTGSADINPALNPYKDIHGNTVVRTRMVSESDTSAGNATARAQLQLNRFTGSRKALTMSAFEYDIKGEFDVGDSIWVYDPDAGLYNTANEITFRGQRINPIALQVTEVTWPIARGMTVAYRDKTGNWIDLTDYVVSESQTSSATNVVVGDFARSLTTSGFEDPGSRVNSDTSIPDKPSFVFPFISAVYLDVKGFTKASLSAHWSAPLNVDGSTIQDGDHYEIQYTVDTDHTYPQTWANLQTSRWGDLGVWGQPFTYPDGGLWNVLYVPWPDTSVVINDLATGVGYKLRIRAVDKSGNEGLWSSIATAVTTRDNIPPSQPLPPLVASSRIAIQVTHNLGTTANGDWTLENDLDHLNVHVGYGPDFYPDDTNQAGRLRANSGMVQAQIPAVGSFQVESTNLVYVKVVAVDIAGNKSVPSLAGTATADLIDDAHISSLTVSKVTAGVINADFVVGSRIKTADSGARVELNSSGLQAYNSAGSQTVNVSSSDGSVQITGTITSSNLGGGRLVVNPVINGDPELRFYVDAGTNYHYITSFLSSGNTLQLSSNSDPIQTLASVLDLSGSRMILALVDPSTFGTSNYIQQEPINNTITLSADGIQLWATNQSAGSSIDTTNAIVGGGGGLSFSAQGDPGQGFRFAWTGSAIQIARNDTNTVIKTFIIDHPLDDKKFLVHATTESPYNGVEYWGEIELDSYGRASVELPVYFEALTRKDGRAVFLTPVGQALMCGASEISEGKFRVHGPASTKVSWLVKAIRKDADFDVEPLREGMMILGDGPYKYALRKRM